MEVKLSSNILKLYVLICGWFANTIQSTFKPGLFRRQTPILLLIPILNSPTHRSYISLPSNPKISQPIIKTFYISTLSCLFLPSHAELINHPQPKSILPAYK